jgi:uncharacterized protein YuzE
MKITYDPKHNIAYICFRKKSEQVQTIQVSDEVNIDIAPDGSVYGIELLNAKNQLTADHLGSLIVENQESGESESIKLAV